MIFLFLERVHLPSKKISFIDMLSHISVANSNTVSDEDRENAVAQIRELEEGGRDPSHVIAGLKAYVLPSFPLPVRSLVLEAAVLIVVSPLV